ncbi:MAG: hypothetical protein L0K64_10995, partial [Corynebacterium flavescens]
TATYRTPKQTQPSPRAHAVDKDPAGRPGGETNNEQDYDCAVVMIPENTYILAVKTPIRVGYGVSFDT